MNLASLPSPLDASRKPARHWQFRNRTMTFGGRLRLMGIVNVTPDSFSDGGAWATAEAAAAHASALLDQGADLVDIGGESTRPGAEPVSAEKEIRRIVPVIRTVRAAYPDAVLSVDTRKANVAARALEAGADIVNDVSALSDPDMATVVQESGAGLVLMHMQGQPATMQQAPAYDNVAEEVRAFLEARCARACAQGISRDCLVVDPGIGFGKSVAHNLSLLRRLDVLNALDRPILVGVSRKSLVGAVTDRPVEDRLAGSLAWLAWLALRGISLARVHDVKASVDVVRTIATIDPREE